MFISVCAVLLNIIFKCNHFVDVISNKRIVILPAENV